MDRADLLACLHAHIDDLQAVYAFDPKTIPGAPASHWDGGLALLAASSVSPVMELVSSCRIEEICGLNLLVADLGNAELEHQYHVVCHGQRWWQADEHGALFEALIRSRRPEVERLRQQRADARRLEEEKRKQRLQDSQEEIRRQTEAGLELLKSYPLPDPHLTGDEENDRKEIELMVNRAFVILGIERDAKATSFIAITEAQARSRRSKR